MSMVESQRCHIGTDAEGPITEDAILLTDVGNSVTKYTTPTLFISSPIAKATSLTTYSSGSVTRPPALVASVLSHRFWWFT